MATEIELTAILCSLILGGETEVRHYYPVVDRTHHIRVDCETPTHVVEVGFDAKRSSQDSLHQALFAAEQSGKLPMVVIIDTNGIEENVQYQVRTVARSLDVSYLTVTEDFLIRWQMTEPFRNRSEPTLFGY
ncbi:hypothetical protein [Yoonia sp. 208BN28-4]|uniref:hypothetical protein n=1 Tax=Yoonia sp. 208BN28-4 TaxID=3126505 RepID=UPI00309AC0EB